MDALINLTGLQVLDLFFRFAAAGQLLLAAVFLVLNATLPVNRTKGFLLLCLMAYILLTAPIDNADYGWFRPPLLLLTDLTAYALLFLYWQSVHGISLWQKQSLPVKGLFVIWFSWLGLFFLVFKGRGVFHDIHHLVTFIIILLVLFDAIKGYRDDLVEKRRFIRRLTIGGLSVHMLFLTLLELMDSALRDNEIFSVSHACLLFVLSGCSVLWLIRDNSHSQREVINSTTSQEVSGNSVGQTTEQAAKPASPVVEKLSSVMSAGLYSQNDLSIGKLAEAVQLPEHQLRVVINTELGFDNFSHFVSSYRIPVICEKLRDPSLADVPILTLALDSGFNSIASFNRIFKRWQGMTPSDYRAQFQN